MHRQAIPDREDSRHLSRRDNDELVLGAEDRSVERHHLFVNSDPERLRMGADLPNSAPNAPLNRAIRSRVSAHLFRMISNRHRPPVTILDRRLAVTSRPAYEILSALTD